MTQASHLSANRELDKAERSKRPRVKMACRCNEGKSESRNSLVQARSGRAGLCRHAALDTETDLDSGKGKQSE
eukprot:5644440-Alexandrium_andersonii.AAC.1